LHRGSNPVTNDMDGIVFSKLETECFLSGIL
jgi:hypothetical protein